ncbi:MAG: hypothetical protein IPI49_22450 [Myxococcales bacterium]|nr:hypothetical protein [Myxococcales bacterium]
MLSASIVLEAAQHIADDAKSPSAILAWHAWHWERTVEPLRADWLKPLMEQVLPAELLASGLPPDELAQLEQNVQFFEAHWQHELAAGDDPLAPLPLPTEQNNDETPEDPP